MNTRPNAATPQAETLTLRGRGEVQQRDGTTTAVTYDLRPGRGGRPAPDAAYANRSFVGTIYPLRDGLLPQCGWGTLLVLESGERGAVTVLFQGHPAMTLRVLIELPPVAASGFPDHA